MDANERELLNDMLREVVGAAYEVQNHLGPGFLEKVYERSLARELTSRGFTVESQVRRKIYYKDHLVGEYIADLIVNDQLLVELKCSEALAPEHLAQCLNYLKASGLHLGLLLNFQTAKVQWKRIVHQF